MAINLERVDGGREGNRAEKNEQVSDSQIENECVWYRSHRFVSYEDVNETTVSNDTHQKDDAKDDRNDISLWSLRIWYVGKLIFFCIIVVAAAAAIVDQSDVRIHFQQLTQHFD